MNEINTGFEDSGVVGIDILLLLLSMEHRTNTLNVLYYTYFTNGTTDLVVFVTYSQSDENI